MNPFLEQLLSRGPVLTDGAWGTELQARGLASGEIPDVWNLTHPEKVAEVAQAYVDAGSRVILTNTFGANRLRLEGHAMAAELAEINRQGVQISRQAAGTQAFVFASLGPSGRMILAGNTTEAELKTAFAEQAEALAAGGAHAIVIETMGDLTEATLAVAAARATGLPVVACMVFDAGKSKDRTMTGATPEQTAAALTEAGADVIGANCGQGIAGYVPVCQRLRASTDRPIWIKANAGLPLLVEGRVVYHTSPEEFAGHIPALVGAGASFVGGCCGTSPAYIRAVKLQMQGAA